jgi:hypothetical protein
LEDKEMKLVFEDRCGRSCITVVEEAGCGISSVLYLQVLLDQWFSA